MDLTHDPNYIAIIEVSWYFSRLVSLVRANLQEQTYNSPKEDHIEDGTTKQAGKEKHCC